MSGDFPDEWFRPTKPDAADEVSPDHGSDVAEERFTDQFKPGYLANRSTNQSPAPEPSSAPDESSTRAAQEPQTPAPDDWQAPAITPLQAHEPPSHSVGVAPKGPEPEPEPEPHRDYPVLLLAGTAVVALAVGSVGSQLWDQYRSRPQPTEQPSASPSPTTPAAKPWGGAVSVVKPRGVIASCTAPPQPGYGGEMVPSDAVRVLDGDPSTGWRCDGSGLTHTLAFTFPKGTKVVGVRMTNGYTKAVNGLELYPQYRRVSEVSWSFPALDNAYFVQQLADQNPALQEIRIPETSADGGMQLQITGSTQPGETQITRNAVIITEVEFLVRKS
ncbi:hypothetical protein [Luteococcus sp. OSA5]|uniref:hypothetical protein n=1 Tax=Luteococcus sp. OSA5 TaxID=3401630 RepID=UPI003B42A598